MDTMKMELAEIYRRDQRFGITITNGIYDFPCLSFVMIMKSNLCSGITICLGTHLWFLSVWL